MLHEFLETNRTEILALAHDKTLAIAGPLPSSEDIRRGLPEFYEHLILYLQSSDVRSAKSAIKADAAGYGQELLRLHYSLSQVVQAYGSMCQAITELAEKKQAHITPQEFNELNMCLDVAIAAAVSQFQTRSVEASEAKEVLHLGALAHELRNSLSSATIAFDMVNRGLVGAGGNTAKVLGESLKTMRNLIDRSLSEVRMRADPVVRSEKFNLRTLIDQILLTARIDASLKEQTLKGEVSNEIELETDRQLLLSVVANLTQNAIKYSKKSATISVTTHIVGKNVSIEVADGCGGLPAGSGGSYFKPFVSGDDKSGLGLGLTIVQRAVLLLNGSVTVRDQPGVGCIFKVEIPMRHLPPAQFKKRFTLIQTPLRGFMRFWRTRGRSRSLV